MTLSLKDERSLVSEDEFATIEQTHFPKLYELDEAALASLQQRVRALRNKELTLARDMRRSIRGKAESRRSSFPGNVEKPARRKRVFSGALKRLGRERARRRAIAAREALKETMRRVQALKRAGAGDAWRPHSKSSRSGMVLNDSMKRRTRVNRAKVGSISQATKVAQARRDVG
jgi:hypothetical protein